jgi:hypothetical protein
MPRSLALGFTLALAMLPVEAAASVLSTAPAYSPLTGAFSCTAVNVGTKTLDLVIRIRRINGGVETEATFVVPPKEGANLSDDTAGDYLGWCEFDFKGSRKALRGALRAADSAAGIALPAQ